MCVLSILQNTVVCLLICLSSFNVFSIQAEEQAIISIGLPSFPPFAYTQEDEPRQGAVVKYIAALEASLPYKFEIRHMPYGRMVQELKTGRLDMAVLFKNTQIAEDVFYVGLVSRSKLLVLPKKDIQLESYSDLRDLNGIAVIRKASFEKRFDSDRNLRKYMVRDYRQGMNMLASNRVDAVVGSLSALEYYGHQQGFELNKSGQALFLQDQEWWLHMSKLSKHVALSQELKQTVEDLFEPYLIYRLYEEEKLDPTPAERPSN